jgi:predicted acyltransferase
MDEPVEPKDMPAEPEEIEEIVDVVVKKEPVHAPPERLTSLDALRGFDMFWIIGGWWIVNGLAKGLNNEWFNQHVIPQTRHVPWEGFTAWDLIMPLFLFIVGVAMPFSFAKRLGRGQSKPRLYWHIIFRVIILWILGMVAQGRLLEYDLSKLRLYSNTLQAIAAGYLIASILLLNLRMVGQLIATVVLLLSYWGLLVLVPVPGHGAGHLTPDGNLAIYIDKLILGPYQDGTTYTWILSSMTFAATVMMGAFAGQLLRADLGKIRKTLFLLAAGVVCAYLGWAWGYVFPIIKHIWTSSMVLFAGGLSLLLLGVFYFVIDVLRLRFLGFFFVVIGMNAIAVYTVTRVYDFRHLADIFVRGLAKWTGDWHDLVRAVCGLAILWLILHYMYRKKTFIKI